MAEEYLLMFDINGVFSDHDVRGSNANILGEMGGLHINPPRRHDIDAKVPVAPCFFYMFGRSISFIF